MLSPCNGCKERWMRYDSDGKAHTCHGECEKYADYQAHRSRVILNRSREAAATGAVFSSIARVKKSINWYAARRHSMKG